MSYESKTYYIGGKIYYTGSLENKGFVIKNKVVSSICKDYLNYSIKLSLLNEFNDLNEEEEIYSNDTLSVKKMEWYIKYIKTILNQLSKDNQEIMINEYFNPKENWWVKKYKRSTFFRNRLTALNEFLSYVF